MGDGYVIVTYRPDIAPADLDALRAKIDKQPVAAVGGPDPSRPNPSSRRRPDRA